jgi:hypothetical protein
MHRARWESLPAPALLSKGVAKPNKGGQRGACQFWIAMMGEANVTPLHLFRQTKICNILRAGCPGRPASPHIAMLATGSSQGIGSPWEASVAQPLHPTCHKAGPATTLLVHATRMVRSSGM